MFPLAPCSKADFARLYAAQYFAVNALISFIPHLDHHKLITPWHFDAEQGEYKQ